MSATINIELFSNYFASEDVKVIQVRKIIYLNNKEKKIYFNLLSLRFQEDYIPYSYIIGQF